MPDISITLSLPAEVAERYVALRRKTGWMDVEFMVAALDALSGASARVTDSVQLALFDLPWGASTRELMAMSHLVRLDASGQFLEWPVSYENGTLNGRVSFGFINGELASATVHWIVPTGEMHEAGTIYSAVRQVIERRMRQELLEMAPTHIEGLALCKSPSDQGALFHSLELRDTWPVVITELCAPGFELPRFRGARHSGQMSAEASERLGTSRFTPYWTFRDCLMPDWSISGSEASIRCASPQHRLWWLAHDRWWEAELHFEGETLTDISIIPDRQTQEQDESAPLEAFKLADRVLSGILGSPSLKLPRQKGIYSFSEDKGDYTELSRFHLWETDAATIALMMRGVNRTGQYDPQLSGILVHRKPETIPYFKEVKEILVESIVRNV